MARTRSRILRRIVQEMGGRLALDSYVVRGGRVAVGDPVELLYMEGAIPARPAFFETLGREMLRLKPEFNRQAGFTGSELAAHLVDHVLPPVPIRQ